MNRTEHASPNATNQLISSPSNKPERVWVTANFMPSGVKHALMSACAGSSDEICGLIDDRWELYYIANIHNEPTHNFLMDTEEGVEVLRTIAYKKAKVLGIFHSHPNNIPWPTPRDLVGWPVDVDWRYFIVNPGRVIEWALP